MVLVFVVSMEITRYRGRLRQVDTPLLKINMIITYLTLKIYA